MLDELSYIDWLLLALMLLASFHQVWHHLLYTAGLSRSLRRARKSSVSDVVNSRSEEGVSLIVCGHNQAADLDAYLQALLSQDYPKYEVIVVNDTSEDDTQDVIADYVRRDSRVKMTFVPQRTTVVSTRKLAITLGAKAAQYGILLLTDPNCRPESKHWISRMVEGFADPKVQIVLGFSTFYENDEKHNSFFRYDNFSASLDALGAALRHRPYRGMGRNLAYRKNFFFQSGGFSEQMNSLAGDDNLFINHFSNSYNTEVVTAPDSFVWATAPRNFEIWKQERRQFLKVYSDYTASSRTRLVCEHLSRLAVYLLPLLTTAMCCVGPVSVWTVWAAWVLFHIRFVTMYLVLLSSSLRMGLRPFGLSVLGYDILLPLINVYLELTAPLQPKPRRIY